MGLGRYFLCEWCRSWNVVLYSLVKTECADLQYAIFVCTSFSSMFIPQNFVFGPLYTCSGPLPLS